jgi:lipoic acid synthetase
MKPAWLKIKLPRSDSYQLVKNQLSSRKINTVCIEAQCPNRIECWEKKSMTFMILGNICTRKCRFCAVETGNPLGVIDENEPDKIALAIKDLNLSYVVITSVTRDDLADGGAGFFALTIEAIRKTNQNVCIEVLVPDFSGQESSIVKVIDAGCDVFGHNIETVKRLTPIIRDQRADYSCSLSVLKTARKIKPQLITKSGIMLGLGETEQEVKSTMRDLYDIGVSTLTIGQYLQPARRLLKVYDYIKPEQFEVYKNFALNLGFKKVIAGPLVRSSYIWQ